MVSSFSTFMKYDPPVHPSTVDKPTVRSLDVTLPPPDAKFIKGYLPHGLFIY